MLNKIILFKVTNNILNSQCIYYELLLEWFFIELIIDMSHLL